ncbi:MAG: hypothetical protein EU536_01610 [Promethearchaeota archaeon]|nr:MAG: hypothetical protein EU536_01610 [Candidatus Lokiarchaeota archaeon]
MTIFKDFDKREKPAFKHILIQGRRDVQNIDPQSIMKKFNEISGRHDVIAQICAASRVATWKHVFFGALYAMMAFNQQRNIANNLAMEILLYLSGQRQIKLAIEEFGVKNGSNVIILLGNVPATMTQALLESEKVIGGVTSDAVMTISEEKKREAICTYFQIGEAELNAIGALDTQSSFEEAIIGVVLNRMALVTLEK